MTDFVSNMINWKFIWYIQNCSVNNKKKLDLELRRASVTRELYYGHQMLEVA